MHTPFPPSAAGQRYQRLYELVVSENLDGKEALDHSRHPEAPTSHYSHAAHAMTLEAITDPEYGLMRHSGTYRDLLEATAQLYIDRLLGFHDFPTYWLQIAEQILRAITTLPAPRRDDPPQVVLQRHTLFAAHAAVIDDAQSAVITLRLAMSCWHLYAAPQDYPLITQWACERLTHHTRWTEAAHVSSTPATA